MPSVTLPGYRGLSVARPTAQLAPILQDLAPDVVHLASPAVLGWLAVQAAADLGVPSVAVFQTDVSAFLRRYHLGMSTPMMCSRLRRLHNTADLTLVPSSATAYLLRRPASALSRCGHAVWTGGSSTRGGGMKGCGPQCSGRAGSAGCWSVSWGGWRRRNEWNCSSR